MIRWFLAPLLALLLAVAPAAATLQVNQLVGFGVDGAALNLNLSFVSSNASTADSSTSYTFSAQSIGTAASDRDVIVVFSLGDTSSIGTVSSVTIGGTTATLDKNISSDRIIIGIARLRVTTGTTADIVINVTGSTMDNCQISVHRLTGHPDGVPLSSNHTISTANINNLSLGTALSVSSGGAVVTGAMGWTASGSPGTWSWSAELTEDVDSGVIETVFANGSAHAAFASSTSYTPNLANSVTFPSGSRFAIWGVSW